MEILRTEHLSKHFGGLKAVNDFSLSVEENTIHGLIGPNGAGKTTFFSVISGFEAPTSGKIYLGEEERPDSSRTCCARKGLFVRIRS